MSFGTGPKLGGIEPTRVPCVPDSTGQWGGLTWQLTFQAHLEEASAHQCTNKKSANHHQLSWPEAKARESSVRTSAAGHEKMA